MKRKSKSMKRFLTLLVFIINLSNQRILTKEKENPEQILENPQQISETTNTISENPNQLLTETNNRVNQENQIIDISEETFNRKGTMRVGFEIEATIASGPYPENSDGIVVKGKNWEIHPDTNVCKRPNVASDQTHKNQNLDNPKCLNFEFASIGGHDYESINKILDDAKLVFKYFEEYGIAQKFEVGKFLFKESLKTKKVMYNQKGLEFKEEDKTLKVQDENNCEYQDRKFPVVVYEFETIFTTCLPMVLISQVSGTPQFTVNMDYNQAVDLFFKYYDKYKNSDFFFKAWRGQGTIKPYNYLTGFNLSQNFNDPFIFLVSLTFSNLFFENPEGKVAIEIKYKLMIMTRISFADMYDSLDDFEKNNFKKFIKKICQTPETTDEIIDENAETTDEIIDENDLPYCLNLKLRPYFNETTGEKFTDNINLSEWFISIIKPEKRVKVKKFSILQKTEILVPSDLLSPPEGLRNMGDFIYGLGKYTDISERDENGKFIEKKIMVELRQYGKFKNIGENFGLKMDEYLEWIFSFDK